VLSEAGFGLLIRFGLGGEVGGEPVGDAGDDLADAGLRDAVLVGELAGGEEIDLV
jgi:hypothetical protein